MLARPRGTGIFLAAALWLLPLVAASSLDRGAAAAKKPRFHDAPSQAAQFIGYNASITLTANQRQLRDRALGRIAAPCCSKFSVATCCCPCNLAKSVWGLANLMIAREGASEAEIQKAVRAWVSFVNPKGFTGDVCDTAGGCGRPFSQNGCGGMSEGNLDAAR